MDVLYPRCAGLDVHKDTVVAGVRLAGDGPVRSEVRTFDTTTPGLLDLPAWFAEQGCTHLAMEATGVYWRPVWHVLSDGEFALTLANAAHVKNVPGRKTDVADALWLADLLAHGLIRASFVLKAPTQELRSLLRTRNQLVREQASHVQLIQKTLEDTNLKLSSVLSQSDFCLVRHRNRDPTPGHETVGMIVSKPLQLMSAAGSEIGVSMVRLSPLFSWIWDV